MLGWLRALVPTALLLVAPAALPEISGAVVVQLDCEDGMESPLSVATELAARTRK